MVGAGNENGPFREEGAAVHLTALEPSVRWLARHPVRTDRNDRPAAADAASNSFWLAHIHGETSLGFDTEVATKHDRVS